jgi:hypothetical protein
LHDVYVQPDDYAVIQSREGWQVVAIVEGTCKDYQAFKREVGELSRSYQGLTHHKELVQLFRDNCMDKENSQLHWRKTMLEFYPTDPLSSPGISLPKKTSVRNREYY